MASSFPSHHAEDRMQRHSTRPGCDVRRKEEGGLVRNLITTRKVEKSIKARRLVSSHWQVLGVVKSRHTTEMPPTAWLSARAPAPATPPCIIRVLAHCEKSHFKFRLSFSSAEGKKVVSTIPSHSAHGVAGACEEGHFKGTSILTLGLSWPMDSSGVILHPSSLDHNTKMWKSLDITLFHSDAEVTRTLAESISRSKDGKGMVIGQTRQSLSTVMHRCDGLFGWLGRWTTALSHVRLASVSDAICMSHTHMVHYPA